MKFPTLEMGEVELLVIWEKAGKWEPEWDPLRLTKVGDLFSRASQGDLDNALAGLSRPLVLALGLPPSGALLKLPPPMRVCSKKKTCVFYDERTCFPTTKKLMPWCYEPSGVGAEKERLAVAKAIEVWREGVYLTVITEEHV